MSIFEKKKPEQEIKDEVEQYVENYFKYPESEGMYRNAVVTLLFEIYKLWRK